MHAANLPVPPCERVSGSVVTKAGSLPAASRMALRAGLAELPVVFVARLVTGRAVLGRPRVLVACMALHTGNLPVPPGERVCGRAVIKGGSLPATGRVALRAALTKLPAMFVVRLVACVAVLWGSTILVSGVALHAGRLLVLPL